MKKNNILIIVFAVIILTVMALSLTKVIDEGIGMCISLLLVIIFNLLVARVAHKNDVKIVVWMMVLFIIIGVVLLGVNIYSLVAGNVSSEYEFRFVVKPNESEKTKIFSYDGRDYYTYNLESVDIIKLEDEKRYPLQEALEGNIATLNEILSSAIPNSDTIGYKIYYDEGSGKYNNDEYAIVVCDSTKDVIFTTYNYTYEKEICDSSVSD